MIDFFPVLKGCVSNKSTWLIPFKYCWDKFRFILNSAPHAISDVLNLLSYHTDVADVFCKNDVVDVHAAWFFMNSSMAVRAGDWHGKGKISI